MISKTIPKRYAKALFAIGRENGEYLKYGEELSAFASLCRTSGDLANALINPLYDLRNRINILEAVLDKTGFSPSVESFLNLLMQKNRISYVEAISRYYNMLTDELENIGDATVVSAKELADEVVSKIKEAIETITKKTIRLQVEVDPTLIGGVVTRVGDLTFDGSVRAQLMSLKESLKRGE